MEWQALASNGNDWQGIANLPFHLSQKNALFQKLIFKKFVCLCVHIIFPQQILDINFEKFEYLKLHIPLLEISVHSTSEILVHSTS